MSSEGPPAGWYQDPNGSQRTRWWSGAQWTEHYSVEGSPTQSTAAVIRPYPALYGHPQDFGSSISAGWRRYAMFEGVARRTEFWYWQLFIVLGALAAAALDAMFTFGVLGWLWFLATLLPTLAVSVRRLRDAGYSWALMFLALIPFAGVALIVIWAKRNPDEVAAATGRPNDVYR